MNEDKDNTAPISQSQIPAEADMNATVHRQILDKSSLGVYIAQKGRLMYANPRAAEMLGYTVEEITGKQSEKLITPEDIHLVEEHIDPLAVGAHTPVILDLRLLHKDGTPVHIELTATKVTYNDYPAVLGSLRDIGQLRQDERALSLRNRRLRALHRISTRLLMELDRKKLLKLIVREAMDMTNSERGAITLFDTRSGLLRYGYSVNSRSLRVAFRPGEGLVGWVFSHNEPALVNDPENDPHVIKALAKKAEVRSLVHAPIRVGDAVLGVLSVFNRRDAPYDRDDLDTLQGMADQAAIAIKNAELLENARKSERRERTAAQRLLHRNKRLRSLYKIGSRLAAKLDRQELLNLIAREAVNIADAESAGVNLLDRESGLLVNVAHAGRLDTSLLKETFEPGKGTIGWAFSHRQPAVINDPEHDPRVLKRIIERGGFRSFAHVPIIAGDDVLGVLSVNNKREGIFGQEDVEALKMIAGQAAIAIRNADLFEDVKQARDREAMLRELLSKIKTSLDPDEALRFTVNELGRLLEASRCIFAQNRGGGFIVTHGWTAPGAPKVIEIYQAWSEFPATYEDLMAGRISEIKEAFAGALPEMRKLGERIGVTTSMAAPVMIGDEMIGFVGVDQCGRARTWTESEKDLLVNITAHLGVALSNAEFVHALNDAHQREQLLNNLLIRVKTSLDLDEMINATVSQLGPLVGASRCYIGRDRGDRWDLLRQWHQPQYPPHPRTTQWSEVPDIREMLAANELVVIHDRDEGVPKTLLRRMYLLGVWSTLLVPVFAGDEFFGFIGLNQLDQPRRWPEPIVDLVRSLAGHLGLAIQNAGMYSELQEKNETLTRANYELSRLAEELDQASKLKSQFLTKTSHELRTPLNSMIGFLRLALDDLAMSQEEEREFVHNAYASARDLLDLVNDLLDIGKIEAGKLDLKIAPIALGEVFDEVRRASSLQVEQKELKLSFDLPAGLVVMADHLRLKQVLLNLIGNAIKFTPTGEVWVRGIKTRSNGFAEISISDTGVGVPVSKQKRLFKEFARAEGVASKYGGTGLGLAISRSLVELMGGTIALTSEGHNKGTVVTFTVPLADPDSQPG